MNTGLDIFMKEKVQENTGQTILKEEFEVALKELKNTTKLRK